MESRRKQDLCYFCDEKFTPGRKCRPKQLYIITGEEEEDNEQTEDIIETISEGDGEISMHALTGNIIHHTIRIQGMIKKKAITILIDSGSTHNFLDSGIANRLAV